MVAASQPLGYTLFSCPTRQLRRAEHPRDTTASVTAAVFAAVAQASGAASVAVGSQVPVGGLVLACI